MNEEFMNIAFEEADKALNHDEVPVGAVIVKDGVILAKAYNTKESDSCVIYHAEINAIKEVSTKIKSWHLDDCDLYVTLDPCPMCASAIKQARIRNVYSALSNSDSNNSIIIKKIFEKDLVNPSVNFLSNLAVDRSKKYLNDFFKRQRNK